MSKAKFNKITIEGARTNNLKNINLDIPLHEITCIYGPSGSGKSSLAFGTLVDESKRRFINSLPNDIKFLWNIPPSADVDLIEPILPVWSLSQINPVVGSRPVVGDLLGATELLSRIFFLFGEKRCSNCHGEIVKSSLGESMEKWAAKQGEDAVFHFLIQKNIYQAIAPIALPVRGAKSERTKVKEFQEDFEFWEVNRAKKKGLKKGILKLEEFLGAHRPVIIVKSDKTKTTFEYQHSGSFCLNCDSHFDVGDFRLENFNPLLASGACGDCDGFGQKLEYDIEKIVKNETLTLDEGAIPLLTYKQFVHLLDDYKKDLKSKKIDPDQVFSKMPKIKWKLLEDGGKYFCGLEEIYGYFERKKYKRSIRILSRRLKTESQCITCNGSRLADNKVSLILNDCSYAEVLNFKINEILNLVQQNIKNSDLSLKKLLFTLKVACELGLGNLRLSRKVKSLSSGEYQRLLLVKILAQEGTGMLFVLDEPSRGLSYEEQQKLMEKIGYLKDQGNTIAIVDHSEFIQKASDYLIKMGPGAGNLGGQIESIQKNNKKNLEFSKIVETKLNSKSYIEVTGGRVLEREFKNIRIPMNSVSWILGDSGSGKSLFFKYLLYNDLELKHTGIKLFDLPYSYKKFHSTNVVKKINYFDPELRTSSSRSTVGTYLGFSEIIRKHYASLLISKTLGLGTGHFSPNSELGKCSTCDGRGVIEVDMQFLENLRITCEDCEGKKLKKEVSNITDGIMMVDEAYNLPLFEVLKNYKLTPKFLKLFEYTKTLNLSHLSLSRTLKSLSGGERLRLQFLKNLNLKAQSEIFIFDNLSIGLSSNELSGICEIIEELKKKRNTVIIIDSNPYFASLADNSINFNNL